MKSIFLTGSNGFVGKNIFNSYKEIYKYTFYDRNTDIILNHDIVLHLAGLAHDTKNTISPDQFYFSNTIFTKNVYDKFIESNAKVFITLSSVKAVTDELNEELFEDFIPKPITHYGKSKLLAENYIFSKLIPEGKRVYVLRPCMIHGPGNKGNLNLLYGIVSKGLPWPLGSFVNSRSYLSIENLCFIIKDLIDREDIPSGIYNVADDMPVSTNEIIEIISTLKGNKTRILYINKYIIIFFAFIGNFLKLPINSERLKKLTSNYVVNNSKIKAALRKSLPVESKEGLRRTFHSFAFNS